MIKEDWQAKMEQDIAESKEKINLLIDDPLLDDDGYPTDSALDIVKLWHWSDSKGWFKFINSIWNLRSWGWHEGLEKDERNLDNEVYRYNISTAGWYGNESIIHAMQQTDMLWTMTWVQSRRGGHYIFEDRELKE